jgi:hypothetical protein
LSSKLVLQQSNLDDLSATGRMARLLGQTDDPLRKFEQQLAQSQRAPPGRTPEGQFDQPLISDACGTSAAPSAGDAAALLICC